MWFVYILECIDDTLYTGITNDLNKRIEKHNKGTGAKYTRGRGPVCLKWSYEAENKSEAAKMEYRIKKLSKSKKIDIINGELKSF
jgi:putative endonuclease